jgi:hypothetical protein
MGTQYWLYSWLDEFHIQHVDTARLLLANPSAVEELRARAIAQSSVPLRSIRQPNTESILAGRGIDLSGRLDCSHPDCRTRQIEELLRRVWHYFDRIIVEDAITHEVSFHWEEGPSQVQEWILSHISVLLQLRELGVENLIEFQQKPPACEVHLRKHAEEAGLGRIVDSLEEEARALETEVIFEVKREGEGLVKVRMDHPLFEHTQWKELDQAVARGLSEAGIRRTALMAVLRKFVAHLTADVSAARKASAPLGAVVGLHRHLLEASNKIGVADVAFRITLPVLDGVSASTLVAIRRDEREHFTRFQLGLKQAITERLKTASSERAEALAKEIERDLIEVNIIRKRERLAASQRALAKKATVGVFLGGLTTTCGLLSGLLPPLAVSGGIAATIAVAGSAVTKHLDDARETELTDMFFAWKAVQHALHKGA